MESLEEYYVVYPKFPTHTPITDNKKAPDKYRKINGQSIYNGGLQHYQRAIAVNWLHQYLIDNQKEYFKYLRRVLTEYPVKIELFFHAPLNYGTIRRLKGNIIWYPAKEDYEPNWDIDNQWIWLKLFSDVLQIAEILPKDTVKYIVSQQTTFVETSDLEDRKLVFKINYII